MRISKFYHPSITVAVIVLLCGSAFSQGPKILPGHVPQAVRTGSATLLNELPASQSIQIALTLPLRNRAALRGLLNQLYTPGSKNFRKFLTAQQFADQFGPTTADYQAVVNYAKSQGFTVASAFGNRLGVLVTGTSGQIENAFSVRMNLYQDPSTGRTFYAPDREPSIPSGLNISHIVNLNNYNQPTAQDSGLPAGPGSGPNEMLMPSDIRAAYYGNGPLDGTGQVIGVVCLLGGFGIDDIASRLGVAPGMYSELPATAYGGTGPSYKLLYYPGGNAPQYQIPIITIAGPGENPNIVYEFGEADEDISYAIGMAPGVSQVRLYSAGSLWSIFQMMANEPPQNMPMQIIDCWAGSETDPSSVEEIHGLLLELAAQGQSVFVASGDTAAWSTTNNMYPADDSLVTSVGGTYLFTNGPGGTWANETSRWGTVSGEAAAGSGGGISPSNVQIPSYQGGILNVPGTSPFLRNGPDVAASSYGWAGGGTSASAPIWGGLMALINQESMESNGTTIGFLNPTLYAIGENTADFHDITGNTISSYNGDFGPQPGWDFVSGWGSPVGIDSSGQDVLFDTIVNSPPAPTPVVNIVAGTGSSVYSGDDGPAIDAGMAPAGLAIDWAGNIWIADSANSRVRMINAATGVISTVVGTGTYGSSGDTGTAAKAELECPSSLAFDYLGDLFIADPCAERVREVQSQYNNELSEPVVTGNSTIVTAAGKGQSGNTGNGGPATDATFEWPSTLVVDTNGEIYILDQSTCEVWMVQANFNGPNAPEYSGNINLVAGNGTCSGSGGSGNGGSATNAELEHPVGLVAGAAPHPELPATLYISDGFGIRKVVNGIINTVPGTSALSAAPLAMDPAGDLFMGGFGINEITASGRLLSIGVPYPFDTYEGLLYVSGLVSNAGCYLYFTDQYQIISIGGVTDACF